MSLASNNSTKTHVTWVRSAMTNCMMSEIATYISFTAAIRSWEGSESGSGKVVIVYRPSSSGGSGTEKEWPTLFKICVFWHYRMHILLWVFMKATNNCQNLEITMLFPDSISRCIIALCHWDFSACSCWLWPWCLLLSLLLLESTDSNHKYCTHSGCPNDQYIACDGSYQIHVKCREVVCI